ncbi:MYND-type zinc finger protein samB [Fusarium sp. LHS14.1]|nr:MYND-type zinc finger protein samB [Fusarium sp. LHS14.1]
MTTDEKMATKENSDTDQKVGTAMYAIRDVPDKGKGLIATKPIPRGTRILAEPPLFRSPMTDDRAVKDEILNKVNSLHPAHKATFFALTSLQKYEADHPAWGIFCSNALKEVQGMYGLYPTAARINHSCVPNAHYARNNALGKLTIHAVKDIAEGDEITIFYLNVYNIRAERQKKLRGFTCTCSLCSLEGERLKESDQRLQLSFELCHLTGDEIEASNGSVCRRPRAVLACMDLLDKEGVLHAYSLELYAIAFHHVLFTRFRARSKILLERAIELSILFLGEDSPVVKDDRSIIRALDTNPVMQYRMDLSPAPEGLTPEALEDWLWRDWKACSNGFTDLANCGVFPRFGDLPIYPESSPDYFALSSDGQTYKPRKAWGLLAGITETLFETENERVHFMVSDCYRRDYAVVFQQGGQNSKALNPKPQAGWTIAILYAKRTCLSLQDVIVETHYHVVYVKEGEKDLVKIFPVALNNIMELSARIQRFSIQHDGGLRTCHACQRQGTSLKACAKCNMFWYCDKDCQVKGWREKSHKNDCKLLKDPGLKAIFHLDWDNMGEKKLSFPL